MNIESFIKPTSHPYGMLSFMSDAHENENVLAFILVKCVEQGSFEPVETKYKENSLVEHGLVEYVAGGCILTKKAKGLLYSVYGV